MILDIVLIGWFLFSFYMACTSNDELRIQTTHKKSKLIAPDYCNCNGTKKTFPPENDIYDLSQMD